MQHSQLDHLVAAVCASAKYRDIAEDVIRNVGARELSKRRNLQAAIKATKSKLHQVGGAYVAPDNQYDLWLNDLANAFRTGNTAELRHTCAHLMSYHSSTRERLAILEQFYTTILDGIEPIHSVIDLACGLHPLAIPWMPLADNAAYCAVDIYHKMTNFLAEFMKLSHVRGRAEAHDVTTLCTTQRFDLAFVLKALPCLEQIDKTASRRILETVNARHMVVSFPVRSLGGKEKGMAINYEAGFHKLITDKPWSLRRFEFATELVFVITK